MAHSFMEPYATLYNNAPRKNVTPGKRQVSRTIVAWETNFLLNITSSENIASQEVNLSEVKF